ncbi:glycerol uptake facilitator protein [Actinomycetospora sp. NBRC 106375]|uniref:MIP/aquaporin family protein n=1 Tax=Actinomycetospora sp. NBRC 106375 TaxID=3032207 RepID=UPI0024A36342|nr:MIP/aquaporin family protein [Actinomycetospora sp. NBRC 106375]GLZ49513.1 glycerol uptake facilitator protein [Actinomycetospora sp. NBRC 106375]
MGAGSIILSEFLGTMVLLLFGCGVVANVLLTRTNADGDTASWVLITFGWGFGVFAGASIADASGGAINPAVTLASAINGGTPWSQVPFYLIGQFLGAFVGAVLAWLVYKLQFDHNEDNSGTLNIFSTNPPIKKPAWNFVTELIATFALVLFLLVNPYGSSPAIYAGAAAVVMGIGQALGGSTGYAINPARDLGPRIAYAVLPIRGKGKADWGYSWVPVVAPLVGATLAALVALVAPVKTG